MNNEDKNELNQKIQRFQAEFLARVDTVRAQRDVEIMRQIASNSKIDRFATDLPPPLGSLSGTDPSDRSGGGGGYSGTMLVV